ncbi:MAG TPA: FecR domain-containing protein [Polyangia bacterium]|jgi:transmembrane sensor|nr:FecR domain-containing protein [Polyangia bacterium]
MTPPADKALGRHVAQTLDDARLDRQVAVIAARTALRSRPRVLTLDVRATCVGAVALATIVGVMAVRSRWLAPLRQESAALAGTMFEAPAGGETITLGDGSRAVLEAHSELTLVTVRRELVRVTLERGGVDFDVTHADGKQFVVSARGYEIRVLGTRFNVRLGEAAGAPALEVRVSRGRVRVARESSDSQDVRVLDAGETWSTAPTPVPETESTAPQPPPSSKAETSKAETRESPRALLARAQAFRAANDPRAAARLFDTLRVRHHGDPRAGLAAFELGRLRLDRLDDPRGAAEAFDDAISIAPDAPFREDAQARLVEAYDASRDRARCLEARAAYLLRYPRGVHRDKIAARCAG